MKKLKQLLSLLLIFTICIPFAGCNNNKNSSSGSTDGKFNIVCSFYPMHILTMNLAKNIDNVNVTSMADPNLGCIHDHTFTTEDFKMIENANVYIENGLELETFNDKIKQAYPNISIIEASKNVTDYIKDGNEINGHVWTNIDDYIKQIQYVSSQLQSLNPENKDKYSANEKEYIDKINSLKNEFNDKISNLSGKKALVLDETLPSLCKYTNIEIFDLKTDHEQGSVSAEQLKLTIDEMKKNDVKSILVAKDTDKKNAEAIAKETGAQIYTLNSCMVGDVSENSYINYMKENLEILSNIK